MGHWFIVLIAIALTAVPLAKILQKAGYNGWWTIVAFIPLVNLIGLWAFAFASWPARGE
jgi:hypothetical protein